MHYKIFIILCIIGIKLITIMENDAEEDGDGTFYSLTAEEANASVYLDSTVNIEPVPLNESALDSLDEPNSQLDYKEDGLSVMDPDHIDISFIAKAGSDLTADNDTKNNEIEATGYSMQSINLTDSDNISKVSESPPVCDDDIHVPEDISSDVVEMPQPVQQPLVLDANIPSPTVTTPTSYFGAVNQHPTFVHQTTPEVTEVEEQTDLSIDSELWLPSQDTLQLISQSTDGVLDPQYLTKARPNSTVAFVSPAIELMMKYHGEAAAQRLQTPLPPVSEANLQQLVKEGRFLSAVNMLTELLNSAEMSPNTIKLWTLRFTLLIKLKLYSTADVEMAMFGNLDNCDLYYEFYHGEHPGKKGSIVPWSLRLLWSILPLHCPSAGGLYGALDRMYGLVYHLDQALLAGLPYLQEQRVIKYKTSLLIQVAGALAGSGSIQPAIKLLMQIKNDQPDMAVPVSNAIIRLYYQVGNIHKGESLLAEVQNKLSEEEKEMNNGFKCIAHGEYNEAYQHFARVVNLNPTNAVASINGAVCLLYLGKLSDSIVQFEGASKISLHPMLLFNLVSLYELKTIANTTKKYHLLDSITSKSDWEAFPFECLRL